MKSGYKILWTDYALEELNETFDYLEYHWSNKEIKNLASEIELVVELISRIPMLFPESTKKKGLRKALVTPRNTIYFRISGGTIEIISFFSNRKNPSKIKLD